MKFAPKAPGASRTAAPPPHVTSASVLNAPPMARPGDPVCRIMMQMRVGRYYKPSVVSMRRHKKLYQDYHGRMPLDVFDYIRVEHGIDLAVQRYCFSDRGIEYYMTVHGRRP